MSLNKETALVGTLLVVAIALMVWIGATHIDEQAAIREELLAVCLRDTTMTEYKCRAEDVARGQKDALNNAATAAAVGLIINGGK